MPYNFRQLPSGNEDDDDIIEGEWEPFVPEGSEQYEPGIRESGFGLKFMFYFLVFVTIAITIQALAYLLALL